MSESVYTVNGMTCGHCVSSVTEEVGRIGGVSAVAVDLPTGQVTITSTTPIALDDVRASGRSLVPRCPFIRAYIERHPEYADLVSAPGSRPRG